MEKQRQKSLLARLYIFAGSYKHLTTLGMILSGISAIMTLLPIIFIWRGISEIIAIYPNITLTDSIQSSAWLAVGSAIGAMVIYMVALMCTHISAFRIAKNMRKTALGHIMSLPLGFFGNMGSGKLRRIINDSAGATETYLAHQLPDMVGAFTTPIAVLVVLFVFDWRLGLISLIPLVLTAGSMMSGMFKGQADRINQYQTALENMNNEATEYVRGIPVVKTFNQSVFSFERFHGVINTYKKYVSQYAYNMRMPMTMFQVFLASTPIFLVLSSIFIISGQSDMIDFFLSFFFYLIFTPTASLMLMKIMWVSQHSMMAADAITRIESLINEKPLQKSKNPKTPQNADIVMENISFTYPGSEKKAVDNVSISIKEGQTVTFVGPSGGGKSTAMKLAARFWDIHSGNITIGGEDVSTIEPETLLKEISIVFQDVTLFNNTVLENIRIGRKSASDQEVMQAAKDAMCHDFIMNMPDGYSTLIGENGSKLSGGERQRLSIARALLKDAPIVLLDEATSSLDIQNESAVQKAISRLTKNKTVIVIAHRMRTIAGANKIVLLKDGRVAAEGSHGEMLKKSADYENMIRLQTESMNWKLA